MSIRKTVFLIAASLCSIIPLQASAGDLVVNNRTDFDSTSIINNGACSDKLGSVGISRAHTEHNVVPDAKVRFACKINTKNCKAEVKITNNCSGPTIATVFFDVDGGIKQPVTTSDPRFDIIGSGFEITLVQK